MTSEKRESNGRGRSVRVPDQIWLPAQTKAETSGTNIASVFRERLEAYLTHEGRASTPGVGVMRSIEGITPPRSIYVTNDLWDRAGEKADAVGETLTAVVISSLIRYITGR